jgi:hypothetical protein
LKAEKQAKIRVNGTEVFDGWECCSSLSNSNSS